MRSANIRTTNLLRMLGVFKASPLSMASQSPRPSISSKYLTLSKVLKASRVLKMMTDPAAGKVFQRSELTSVD